MKKKLSKFLILILILVLVLSNVNIAFANSASLSISGGGSYTKGSSVTITGNYSSSNIGSAIIYVDYDSSILEFVSCSGGVGSAAAGRCRIAVSGTGMEGFNKFAVSINFTAKATGTSNVTFTTDIIDYSGTPMDCSVKSTTVKVTNPEPTVSSNANLSSLYVSAGSLSPAFSASRTSYTVYVDSDETVCLISADTQDSDATIDVTGSKNLIMGRNVRSVIVTAPSGKTKTYTITIYREDGESGSNENDDPNKPEDEDEKDAVEEIVTTIGKEEYIIQEDIKSEDVPEDFRLVVGKYEGKDIPLIKDNDLKYTLGLLKHKESGDLKWFFYDEAKSKFSKTKTFSPEEVMDYVKLSATEVEENNGYFDQNAILLLSVLGGTLVLLVLVVIVLQVKIMGKKKSSKKAKKNAKQEE